MSIAKRRESNVVFNVVLVPASVQKVQEVFKVTNLCKAVHINFCLCAVNVGEFCETNAGSNPAAECERRVRRDAGQRARQTFGGGEASLFF